MKTITNLSGTAAEGQWNFQAAKISVELDYSIKGVARGTQHSNQGLLFYRGNTFVGIPMAELWKLVEQIEPKFKEPRAPISATPEPAVVGKTQ